MFDRKLFEFACEVVCDTYEQTAPTVATWADSLYSANDDNVTLSDIRLLSQLADEKPPANLAANQVYHLLVRQQKDTTGQIGF